MKKTQNKPLTVICMIWFLGSIVYLITHKGNIASIEMCFGQLIIFFSLIAFIFSKTWQRLFFLIPAFIGSFIFIPGYMSSRNLTLPNGKNPMEILLAFVIIFPFLGLISSIRYMSILLSMLIKCSGRTKGTITARASVNTAEHVDDRSLLKNNDPVGVNYGFLVEYEYTYRSAKYVSVHRALFSPRTGTPIIVHFDPSNPKNSYNKEFFIYMILTLILSLTILIFGGIVSTLIFRGIFF
ncbi:MAG: hypothetical protein PHY47_21850 [Lachnospiraceae bacterium]|nr:hypothetical protein [Lachnospiraceae bacterium]